MISNRIIVEKMINGGFGLARQQNGQVVLVKNCLPGEEISYKIIDSRKATLFALPVEFFKYHKERIDPPCPYYGRCGGCDLQHCSYTEQLTIKEEIIGELLAETSLPCRAIVPSPSQFGYRQRIRLQVMNGLLGFLEHRSKRIVPIECCMLAHPSINQCLKLLCQNSAFDRLTEICREIELLYEPESEKIVVVLHLSRKARPSDRNRARAIAGTISEIERFFFTGNNFALEGPYTAQSTDSDGRSKRLSFAYTDVLSNRSISLSWEVGGFCQVNLDQNLNLISYVLKRCAPCSTMELLDLYCGMGNFSIPLALSVKRVTGVEGQGSSIRSAKFNSNEAGMNNTRFIRGEIGAVCTQLAAEGYRADITVIDPPRQGIPGLTEILSRISGKTIVYISCDPATLARDLKTLKHRGFSVVEIQPFDMFPQTHHIEIVAILEKD